MLLRAEDSVELSLAWPADCDSDELADVDTDGGLSQGDSEDIKGDSHSLSPVEVDTDPSSTEADSATGLVVGEWDETESMTS